MAFEGLNFGVRVHRERLLVHSASSLLVRHMSSASLGRFDYNMTSGFAVMIKNNYATRVEFQTHSALRAVAAR